VLFIVALVMAFFALFVAVRYLQNPPAEPAFELAAAD
jgi:hypothetical protein